MPANVYECMFLLDTNKVAGDVPAAAQTLHGTLEKQPRRGPGQPALGRAPLAYPIHNQKKGLYYLTYFRTEGKNLVSIEHDLPLNEMILLRFLILHDRPEAGGARC